MSHTGIFCTKIEIDVKVGELVDVSGYTEANINDACAQAESLINCWCRKNFSDAYASLNADVKRILSEAAACWVAISFIAYNMSGYSSRAEAQTNIDVNWAKFQTCISILSDQATVSFMTGA